VQNDLSRHPYYAMQSPQYSQEIADDLWEEAQLLAGAISTTSSTDASTIDVFNIRRGDMQHECNTTLPKIKFCVECFFGECTASSSSSCCSRARASLLGNMTVLVSTEETKKVYLEQVYYNMLEWCSWTR
jgi:hypothetical protein